MMAPDFIRFKAPTFCAKHFLSQAFDSGARCSEAHSRPLQSHSA